jgi:hypothetical protein
LVIRSAFQASIGARRSTFKTIDVLIMNVRVIWRVFAQSHVAGGLVVACVGLSVTLAVIDLVYLKSRRIVFVLLEALSDLF